MFGLVLQGILFSVCQALRWTAEKETDEIINLREQMIGAIEEADARMRKSGVCESWYEQTSPDVRKVAGETNGRLFASLLAATEYCDVEAADLFRRGVLLCLF